MKRKVGMVAVLLTLIFALLPVSSFAKENNEEQQLQTIASSYSSMPPKTIALNPVILKNMRSVLTLPNKNSKYRISSTSPQTVYEQEPNNDPSLGEYDNFPLDYGMIGTMSNQDIDYHKIDITKPGTLMLGGGTIDYHKVGFLLLDSNLNVVTTADDFYSDPTTNNIIEIMPNLPVGTYYVAVIDITQPQDSIAYGYVIYAAMKPTNPVVNTVRVNDNNVTGRADPGDTISVQDAVNHTTNTGTVDNNGNFTVPIGKQKIGAPLTVQAQDPINDFNSDPITVTVAPAIDNTPPSTLTVNSINNTTTYVSGKTESGATIVIKVANQTIGLGQADINGNFKVKINAQKPQTLLYISAIDAAGNAKTINVRVIAKDTIPPSKLTVNTIHKTTTYVTGNTEVGATIKIKVGSRTIGTGKADSKGNFKVKIPAQKLHTKLTISAIDAAGNAKTITVTVK